jgi:hypothetical protein
MRSHGRIYPVLPHAGAAHRGGRSDCFAGRTLSDTCGLCCQGHGSGEQLGCSTAPAGTRCRIGDQPGQRGRRAVTSFPHPCPSPTRRGDSVAASSGREIFAAARLDSLTLRSANDCAVRETLDRAFKVATDTLTRGRAVRIVVRSFQHLCGTGSYAGGVFCASADG